MSQLYPDLAIIKREYLVQRIDMCDILSIDPKKARRVQRRLQLFKRSVLHMDLAGEGIDIEQFIKGLDISNLACFQAFKTIVCLDKQAVPVRAGGWLKGF